MTGLLSSGARANGELSSNSDFFTAGLSDLRPLLGAKISFTFGPASSVVDYESRIEVFQQRVRFTFPFDRLEFFWKVGGQSKVYGQIRFKKNDH